MSKRLYVEGRDIILEAAVLKNKLFRIGFFKSAHLMDKVTNQLGWEMAEQLEKEQKEKKGKRNEKRG